MNLPDPGEAFRSQVVTRPAENAMPGTGEINFDGGTLQAKDDLDFNDDATMKSGEEQSG